MSFKAYVTPDDITTEKSTINKKNDIYVTDISDGNMLHQFASYNSLFTLSGIGQKELENTTTLLNSRPHDIIVRSSGIGPTEDQNVTDEVSLAGGVSAEDQKILDKNERLRGAVSKSRRTLDANRDLYIRNVTMNGVPGLNEKRRLTSVTNIDIEIVEPAGITLLERVRGAAINNGYLDHIDAPFLLTLEFKGFDELGRIATAKDSQNMKRLIPVKLVDMQMSVDQSGTVYSVKAIPYNEFAYVNRYNYPRTSGTLSPIGKKLSDVFIALEKLLNKQIEDEKNTGLVEKPDIYTVTFDSKGIEDTALTVDNLEQTGMVSQALTGPDQGEYIASGTEVPPDYMKINTSFPITKILEEIMKGHPAYSDDKFSAWKSKVSNELNVAQFKGGAQGVVDKAQDFYFEYFKIRSSIVPIEGSFDNIRATQQKKINFHVEPYKVHAYSLAIPGVSTGQNFKNFVFKTYNYIFTGENVDVMDLDINYRVAYFQSRLKDFEASDLRKNRIEDAGDTPTGGTSAVHHFSDPPFVTKSEPATAKSEGTGKTGGTPTQLDAFLDSLTHPLADMVNIKLTVLGDPAWISQSQFIPLNAKNFTQGTGKATDPDIDYWRSNRGRIWNDELRCYNTDVAEPILMLNFRMPTDINNLTGLYELQSNQSAAFSGLYRVVQVEHNFSDGKFTNVLNLTRFNNQGVIISTPIPSVSVTAKNGESFVLLKNELTKYYSANNLINVKTNIVSLQKKFIDLASATVSRVKGKVLDKIKGFIS